MSKHTQGEWVASGNGVHKGTRCVATTHMEPKEQRDTDARLIAAAPDLLEALRMFVDCRDEAKCIDDCVPDASERAWKALIERMNTVEQKARAAIAKATGEQQ